MKRTKRLCRIIIPIVAIICTVIFTTCGALWMWAAPLPDTVHEQVDNAIGHNLDGLIVYVDKKGRAPEFYTAGWKNKENKIAADPHASSLTMTIVKYVKAYSSDY